MHYTKIDHLQVYMSNFLHFFQGIDIYTKGRMKVPPAGNDNITTSSPAHLFAKRGERKRVPGTLAQTEDIFLKINYGIRVRRY